MKTTPTKLHSLTVLLALAIPLIAIGIMKKGEIKALLIAQEETTRRGDAATAILNPGSDCSNSENSSMSLYKHESHRNTIKQLEAMLLELQTNTKAQPNSGTLVPAVALFERRAIHIRKKAKINLLFSEIPLITYDKSTKAGQRIEGFIKDNNAFSLFQEGAEISAALSGCFLRLDIDNSISNYPILSIINPKQAFPTFAYNRLKEILFFDEIRKEQGGTVVFRLFENRKNENGNLIIEFKLYKGTDKKIGNEINIDSLEETAKYKNMALPNMIGLGVVYVPNMRPNKIMPSSYLGINDFSSCISLLDSLDMAWSSMTRDIELGLGQIFVDEELLSRDQNLYTAEGKSYLNNFSKFQKTFIKLDFSKKNMSGDNSKPIEAIQFDMRIKEHLESIEGFIVEIIGRCGYSPNTFGYNISGSGKDSGTALKIKERKSFFTRGKKENYWVNAIYNLLIQVQYMDNSGGLLLYNKDENISVNLEDSILVDVKEQSETIRNLEQARAISTYIKVKMQYPSWEEEEINAEVKRIQGENGLTENNGLNNNDIMLEDEEEEEEKKETE